MKFLKKIKEEELDRLCRLIEVDYEYDKLDREVLMEFLRKGEVCQYERGELLGDPGEIDTHIYILVDGITRQWHWSGDKEVTKGFGLPPTISIHYMSYYGGRPSNTYYEACCRSKVLRFSKEDFDAMNEAHHQFALWSLNCVQNQLFYYELKDSRIHGSVKEQYEAVEKNRPEIIRNVPLKTIASYLGVSPQYLSKIRNKKHKNDKNGNIY